MCCSTFGRTLPGCLKPRAPRKARSCWHHLTHHGQLPGQTEVRWTWFQTAPFPEVLAQSLHQAKSCKKECWRFANNAFYYIVHMASLSLFELFGLSFARTGKNGDLIARASRNNFCSNCRESPQWPPKQMASRQALLGKDIHSGHRVQLACSGVAGTRSKTNLKSGGHGFKLHHSRRCWLKHCIRQKAARKNVDGLPTMPCLAFLTWIII